MFIHWILQHIGNFLPHVMIAGATIGLIDMGNGGGTDGAIIGDAGTGGDTGTGEDGSDSGNQGEGGESGENLEAGSEEPGTGDQPAESTEGKVDWRSVPPAVKAHIAAIAKTDRTLANQLQNAVYTSQTMLREFPGGLKEAQSLKTAVEEAGGLEGIAKIQETHDQLVEEQEILDNKARTGDVSVLDNLAEIAGAEGFVKLVPKALDMMAKMDPDTYSHIMGKVIINALQEGGVVANLNLAFRMLALNNEGATKEGIEAIKAVAEWANKINSISVTAPKKPDIDPGLKAGQEALNAREAAVFNKEFGSEFGSWRDGRITEEINLELGKRTLNPEQRKVLGNKIVAEIANILTADSKYMKDLNKIYATRNKDELLKFTKNRTDKLLRDATKKSYRALFSNPGKKVVKPQVGADGKPIVAAPAAAAAQVVKGWTKIEANKAPAPDEVDNTKTPFDMKFKKQAILKNGQKVYWGTRVPTDS